MKKLLLAATLMAFGFGAANAQEVKKPINKEAVTKDKSADFVENAHRQVAKLDKIVTLTDSQKSKITDILLSKKNSTLDRVKLEAEIKKEVEPLLTKEQIRKYDAFVAKEKANK